MIAVLHVLIASMRPGRLTPENRRGYPRTHHASVRASMRPGRLTPENAELDAVANTGQTGFNEAGAINPGKPRMPLLYRTFDLVASMRPGRLTPENPYRAGFMARTKTGFNEAGAINPGKPSPCSAVAPVKVSLQ